MTDAANIGAIAAKLEFIQFGRETKRYHGLPMLDHQRVDSHLYGQMALIPILLGPGQPERAGRLLLHTVYDGDIAEWRTGDMPATFKRSVPGLRESMAEAEDGYMRDAGFDPQPLAPEDKRVVKLADAAEGCLHCLSERYRGNHHPRLMFCFYEFWKYLTEDYGLDNTEWLLHNEYTREEGEAGLRKFIAWEWTRANGGEW